MKEAFYERKGDNIVDEVKFSIRDLEMIYMTDYDEDELEQDQGDDVLNYLTWLKEVFLGE